MRIIRTGVPSGNPNLPTLNLSPAEQAIQAIPGLSLWLEGESPGRTFYVRDSAGAFAAWVCRRTGRRFLPIGAAVPIIGAAGARRPLQFGYGPGLTGSANGRLRAEGLAPMLGTGKMTTVALVRLPTSVSPVLNAGGYYVGSNAAAFYGLATGIGGNQLIVSIQGAGRINYAGGAMGNGQWRLVVHSHDADANVGVLRIDGATAVTSTTQTFDNVADAAVPIIGGTGIDGATTPMVGQHFGALHIQGLALADPANAAHLSAVESYFGAHRAALNAAL
ncbi:hypothetical protein [Pseudoroseomonas cervicalis]|uniref:hypothetical protein n=1 Tax=Teichococcus cervicalis TaxID=204525 RepID=UPI0022F196D1|nr:hypothetical protein [Pseudoroseomonas cervicalis]WBV42716.1 hypothetical protein PFY06_15950 [Pseudoroseomonas cervicalis]